MTGTPASLNPLGTARCEIESVKGVGISGAEADSEETCRSWKWIFIRWELSEP